MSRSNNGPSHFNRRQILAGLLVSAASGALAGAPKRSIWPKYRGLGIRLQAAGPIDQILADANLSGKVGFVVADAESGQILESNKPLLTFPPASVTKTITTVYGLETLGKTYRFSTRLIATGTIENGRLTGDLYLVGGGDPTLDSDALGDMASELKATGVREISGQTFVHSSALPYQKSIDPAQPEHLGYNPSLSGLNLNYNRVFFEWKRNTNGFDITMDARAIKFRPRVTTATMEIVDRRSPVFAVTTTATQDQWTVAKGALGKKGGRWLPVRRPEFYAAEVFQTIARSNGIRLPDFKPTKSVPTGTVLAEWHSDKLGAVLKRMLKYSTNLIAEAVGVTASRKRGGNPATLRASGRMMTDWLKTRTGAKHAKFVDHSGLGEGSRISARDMVKVLANQGWNGPLHGMMKEFGFHDSKGRPVKNQATKVKAKTGTLNFVSALAGYVQAPGGRKLVFAIFTADMPRRATIKRAERERPKGARSWNRRAKTLEQKLIERWVAVF